jgi:uncharacterized protein (DUF849 family)
VGGRGRSIPRFPRRRTGFEDTLTLPDGSRAETNAVLVTAARRIVDGIVSP